MSLQISETVQPGVPTGRVHWLVAMNRRNRSMAFVLLWPAMAAQMRGLDAVGPLAWTLLTLHLLLLPQLMYWRACRSAQPRETEVGHMFLDALYFGLWSGWLGHPLWITAATSVCITANLMAFRGPRGALQALGLYLAGGALMTLGLGITPVLETDRIATLLSLLTLEVYLLGFAYGAYQRSMLLHRTRAELQQRERDLQQRLDQIAALQERLTEQARRDPLTGLHNRRFLTERLHELTRSSSGAGTSIGVMLVDIDHFKQVNDRHGHLAGDRVLQAVARLLALAHEEGAEVVCRYGGEEFLLLLPDRGAARMRALAERLRGGVEALRIEPGGGTAEPITVTLSIGWASGQGEPIERLIDRADRALYRAKQAGRNRVESGLG
ncbi:MAG: GGDEF domain-containing protein [Sphaerotilus sulfidivorans]